MPPLAADLDDPGWRLCPAVVPPDLVGRLADAVDRAVAEESAEHPEPDFPDFGRVLFPPRYGGAFTDLFDLDVLFEPIEATLGDDAILYTMSTAAIPGLGAIATGRWHVDVPRVIEGYHQGVGAVVYIDDLTEENGAPEFLPHSHLRTEPPADHEPTAFVAAGPSGSVCYFHPRVWHRSRPNHTTDRRRTVLLLMQRVWMKQRFDVRMILDDEVTAALSPTAARRLGLEALPPGSYDEYYRNAATGRHRRN